MGKPNFQRIVISRVTNAAPDLKYIAYYHAEDTCINACMNGYTDRAFVYILTVSYNDSEHILYVGKSQSQYSRFIAHLKNYAFDFIYLFECEPDRLTKSEAAVICEFKPLLNQIHNPEAKHNKQFLGIRPQQHQDTETIHCYLDRRERYTPIGLYGFSLPPAVFTVLERKAAEDGCNCSEIIQRMLEESFAHEITEELLHPTDTIHTNLVTAKTYGALHRRSREQIKQYLNQGNRVLGTAKIGRDWVLLNDAKFPTDMRRKLPE